VIGKGKGKKERYIYLGHYALEAIDGYIKESRQDASKDDFLFVKGDGMSLTTSGIRSMLVRLGERLGLGVRLSPHRLRHTFATLSLKYGAKREELQKEMGHSNPKTTEGYLHVPDDDVSAAHKRFSPLSNLMRDSVGQGSPETEAKTPLSQPSVDNKKGTPQRRYSKEAHEQVRGLAEELRSGISLPWITDSFIPELAPGLRSLGKERFPITVTEKGKIQITFSVSGRDQIDLLNQALRTHLETGGFADLLTGISAWGDGVAENLYDCHELLNKVRGDIEKTYGVSIPVKDEGKPGFTIDFPILICADAVDKASGFKHFSSFGYGYDGLVLKFGGGIIYFGCSKEESKRLEEVHSDLRSKCTTLQQTKSIAKRRGELDREAIAINRQLQKFIAFDNLPGYCELCT
jgi:hypothetical protein